MKKTYKPILFSTPMVQAILAGRKTQTRRICKYQRNENGKYELTVNNEISELDYNLEGNDGNPFIAEKHQIGDILWVREIFIEWPKGEFQYKALAFGEELRKWKPSIHMPKKACRIFLEVTNVRCERLHDISEADAIAEGVEQENKDKGIMYKNYLKENSFYLFAEKSFKSLWESINGKDSWQSNPWVWVYEFKKIEKPTVWPQ